MTIRTGLHTAAAVLLLSQIAAAQEVRLVLPEAAEDLRPGLEQASLAMSLGDGTELPAPQDYVAAARADYRRLLTALYAEGHYGGTISILVDGREAAGIAPLDSPARIATVEIRVDPGPRFTFGQAQVAPLAPGTELPAGFAPGETARAATIRSAVGAGIDGWRALGHARAAPVTEDVVAIHPEQRLDAAIALDPGPQLTFGPLSVRGNQAVRTDRIVEIAGIRQDRLFSPEEMARAAARLRRSGAFSAVALTKAEENGPNLTLPIEALVTEALPRRVGAGAELSSTEGLTLSAYWMHRNLLGGAERFRIEAEVKDIGGGSGGIDYGLNVSFDRPATLRADRDLLATAGLSRLDEETYQLDQLTANVGFVRYVGEDLTFRIGAGFVTARETTDFRERDYTLVTLPLQATLDRRDDPFDATSGYYIDVAATPFLSLVDADNGMRLYTDARAYRSFGEGDRLTLAGRVQLGSVQIDQLLDAPADYLFYSGGGGTVRGQPYQSLGIGITHDSGTGPGSVRVGGAFFAGAQLEARVRVTDRIGAVGFYDIGTIDSESWPTGDGAWHAGAGLGLRYDTGIGPIRLDIATPVTGDSAGERVELYIGIGQAF